MQIVYWLVFGLLNLFWLVVGIWYLWWYYDSAYNRDRLREVLTGTDFERTYAPSLKAAQKYIEQWETWVKVLTAALGCFLIAAIQLTMTILLGLGT